MVHPETEISESRKNIAWNIAAIIGFGTSGTFMFPKLIDAYQRGIPSTPEDAVTYVLFAGIIIVIGREMYSLVTQHARLTAATTAQLLREYVNNPTPANRILK